MDGNRPRNRTSTVLASSIDEPNVRTTLDVRITSPDEHVRLGPGYLVSEDINQDGTTTSHWCLEQRCPSYLLCIVVGDMVRAEGGEFDGIPMAFFAPKPYTTEDLERSIWTHGRYDEVDGESTQGPLPVS